MDTWRVQDASYFDVNSAGLSFGELSVMVDWVVGMRTSTADRALKLRFSEVEMEPALLNVCDYLLWEEAHHADWPRTWRPGIWDVSHSRLVDAQRPLDHMEERVLQCAAEFVARLLAAPPIEPVAQRTFDSDRGLLVQLAVMVQSHRMPITISAAP